MGSILEEADAENRAKAERASWGENPFYNKKNIDTYPKLQILNPFKVHSAGEWNHNVKAISPVCCFVLWFFSLELLNDAHEPPVCCFVLWFFSFSRHRLKMTFPYF